MHVGWCFAFQAFFGHVKPSIFEGFLKAGTELSKSLEGEDKENLETNLNSLQQRWQVGCIKQTKTLASVEPVAFTVRLLHNA